MSVRKRTWKTKGELKTAWLVDYKDQSGKRRAKHFDKKRDADNWASRTRLAVKDGTHVADRATVTINKAADDWLAACRLRGLEQASILRNEQHVRLHIKPMIGASRLSQVTVPFVRAFSDQLGREGRSPAMQRFIVRTLGAILSDAQELGLVATNAVRELSKRRRGKREQARKRKLQIGADIPSPQEIARIIDRQKDSRARITVMVFAMTGLRASEFRALRWTDLTLTGTSEVHVLQKADNVDNTIGAPKSEAGTRKIPLSPRVAAALREWRKVCPRKDDDLHYVFPNSRGNIDDVHNITRRVWQAAQIRAGVTVRGKPKYSGLHALRHFYASWLINRVEDGGQGLPAKVVQEQLGHSDIATTMNIYGHLFPRVDDGGAALAKAEEALLG